MCLNIGTPKTVNFPFGTNGKLMVLGVPILKHVCVICIRKQLEYDFLINITTVSNKLRSLPHCRTYQIAIKQITYKANQTIYKLTQSNYTTHL